MSHPNPNYKKSIWNRLALWYRGEYDPLEDRLSARLPDQTLFDDEGLHYVHLHLRNQRRQHEDLYELGISRSVGRFHRIYVATAIFLALFITVVLLWTVSFLPAYGDTHAPENNEVATRYIENGLDETGSVNIVTGMILDYRAFDTFGESCVLFVAACCVLILLRVDKDEDPHSAAAEDRSDRHFEPARDTILQKTSRFLVPSILIFGIYVVLNGHLSPGGGFSGGAIIGSGLILYLTAFGSEATRRFLTEKRIRILTVSALTFYCLAKSYSFYTGANHLHSIISTGTPGRILSAGLIVYLNICVGIVVACTMYSFYSLFRKGGF